MVVSRCHGVTVWRHVMSWVVDPTSGGGQTEKAPPGNHAAVLVAIIDLGTQRQKGFQGEPDWDARKLFWVWELVGKKKTGSSETHVIGLDITLSGGEKAKLRQFVEARTGRPMPAGFKVADELGKPCMLNVKLKNEKYPNVSGVAAWPSDLGIPEPKPSYPLVAISLEDWRASGWDTARIPAWVPWMYGEELATVVRRSKEYQADTGQAPPPRKARDGEQPGTPAASAGEQIPF